MRIVYALSGEGRGHGSLARAILPVLQQAGHTCKVITYGQSLDQLKDYDVTPIRGIKHYYDRQGRLSLARSFVGNAGMLAYYPLHWRSLRRQVRAFAPDLCLVNFEPFIPLIARSLRIPILSFDNQHALLHLADPPPPGFRMSAWTTRTAVRCVAPWAEHFVVITFAAVTSGNPRVHVVPPVVNAGIRRVTPSVGRHVLVYLKHPNPRLLEILRRTGERFLVYGYNTERIDHNLTYRIFNDRMPAELAAAKAVIGTAGMSLTSEAVWLRKPFFAVPLKNEYEQAVTAMAVRRLNFGDFAEDPDAGQMARFFSQLESHRHALDTYRFDPDAAGRKLVELIARMSSQTTTNGPP